MTVTKSCVLGNSWENEQANRVLIHITADTKEFCLLRVYRVYTLQIDRVQDHNPQPPTCDTTREGVAHGYCGKGRSSSTEWSDAGWGATKWSDAGGMAVVAAVGTLEGRWLAHLGGVWSIVAHVGGNRGRVRSIWSVLQRWSFVLFTFDAAHDQACREMARG